MTIIVWDGKSLVADKQATNAGLKLTTTKIFKINGNLVGFSGDFDYAFAMKKWFENGADPEKFPKHQEDDNKWVGMIVIAPDKKILKYERSPYPIDLTESNCLCIGSGRDFAFGALAMGADAKKAVEVACEHESSCGMGIDVLTFEGESNEI
jgi:ATP-dependent protease HslVU (ClpYQ) peptidase subunit